MIADLYILPETFAQNPALTIEEIETRINALAADFATFKKYPDENVCYINNDVYNIVFCAGWTLYDLLYEPAKVKGALDRDALNSLQKVIVNSARPTDVTSHTVINDYLPTHDASQCYGIICFNEVAGIAPEYQVIYDHAGWYKFRRYFLGMYPVSAENFMNECCKYFPELVFHEQNWAAVEEILDGNSKKIVYHLTALNDRFDEFKRSGKRRDLVLHDFSLECTLDEIATLEGRADRKDAFTFEFPVDGGKGKKEKVVCEPHLKLCYTDDPPQTYSNERRIYFHEGKGHIHGGKILVGHIGVHL